MRGRRKKVLIRLFVKLIPSPPPPVSRRERERELQEEEEDKIITLSTHTIS